MEVAMTNEQATRRYFSVLIPGGILFLGLSYGLKLVGNAGLLPEAVLGGAALVPAALLVGMFWAHWRYINEIDEFLRSIQIKAAFVGLTVVMTIATAWGYVELYVEGPALSIYWLNPIYWLTYGVAAVTITRRYGDAS
jgi:hypothetical protein